MPRSLQDILDRADLLADRFESHEPDPAEVRDATALRAVRSAFAELAEAEARLASAVSVARAQGHSWSAIGAMVGTSGEAARQRYGQPSAFTPRFVVTCDLDKGNVTAAESLSFGYGGKTYRLDLCRKHLDEVKGTLEGFAAAGRSARGTLRRRRRSNIPGLASGADRLSGAVRGESQAQIREWARAQGYAVGDRGRIRGEVRAAYGSARPKGARRR
jgi:hypothetical protein